MSIDLSKARLSQNYADMGAVEKVHAVIPVDKPPKTAFFRVNPDEEFTFQTFILNYERSNYMIFPDVAAQFPELVKPVRLVLAVTREGNPYLWPLRLPNDDGRGDNWAVSAIEIAELAKAGWMRLSANMTAGCYIAHRAKGIEIEPAWPDMAMEELIQKAFRDFVITDLEHPIARELLGDNTHGATTI